MLRSVDSEFLRPASLSLNYFIFRARKNSARMLQPVDSEFLRPASLSLTNINLNLSLDLNSTADVTFAVIIINITNYHAHDLKKYHQRCMQHRAINRLRCSHCLHCLHCSHCLNCYTDLEQKGYYAYKYM